MQIHIVAYKRAGKRLRII